MNPLYSTPFLIMREDHSVPSFLLLLLLPLSLLALPLPLISPEENPQIGTRLDFPLLGSFLLLLRRPFSLIRRKHKLCRLLPFFLLLPLFALVPPLLSGWFSFFAIPLFPKAVAPLSPPPLGLGPKARRGEKENRAQKGGKKSQTQKFCGKRGGGGGGRRFCSILDIWLMWPSTKEERTCEEKYILCPFSSVFSPSSRE